MNNSVTDGALSTTDVPISKDKDSLRSLDKAIAKLRLSKSLLWFTVSVSSSS